MNRLHFVTSLSKQLSSRSWSWLVLLGAIQSSGSGMELIRTFKTNHQTACEVAFLWRFQVHAPSPLLCWSVVVFSSGGPPPSKSLPPAWSHLGTGWASPEFRKVLLPTEGKEAAQGQLPKLEPHQQAQDCQGFQREMNSSPLFTVRFAFYHFFLKSSF